ncbi:MAG: sodium-dependent bicarbonate transport family permease [Flavobacteriales bacterium]|nr:sodium-dependent bicarbonate transport family permease [Flavobacteriales bacterium]
MDTQLLLSVLTDPTSCLFRLGVVQRIPMALGLTFPFTITVGMPVYLALIMRTP